MLWLTEIDYVLPPGDGGFCAVPGRFSRYRYCRYIGKDYAFICKDKCNKDSMCLGYSIIPGSERCYIYTTSDCPANWVLNNNKERDVPLRTIASSGEDGCFLKRTQRK